MKNKIKEFFKTVFSTKRTKIMFCLAILSFMLLVGVTFAWFVQIIELPQSSIEAGTLDFIARGYDEDGNFISNIVDGGEYDPEDPEKTNAPLFNITNWSSGSVATCYISLENTGSLDLEYALSFVVDGLPEHKENMGGFWYRVERLTSAEADTGLVCDKNGNQLDLGYNPQNAYYMTTIKDYISRYGKAVSCGDECVGSDHVCTERSKLSRNLVTIDHLAEYGSLGATTGKACIYKIDIGFRSDAVEEIYTKTKLTISGKIYATQPNAIEHPDGLGTVFTVNDETTFKNALDNALPGDTIVLGSKINYNGDLIINKCVNITTYGNDLVVNGNLIFNFVSQHTLKINMTSGGNIYVKSKGEAGGNLEINTPNSEVLITGHNYITNIYVDKKANLAATDAQDTKGIFLSGANICNSVGEPKDVDLYSDTRITLDYGAALTLIKAKSKASNIEIVNYGTIGQILLGEMMLIDPYPESLVDNENAQVLIDNYGKIVSAIQIPTWSRPFTGNPNASGEYEGNTMIIREWGAEQVTVLVDHVPGYTQEDVIDLNVAEVKVVQEVPNYNDKLIVYYGYREGKDTTIEILLEEYFQEYIDSSGLMVNSTIEQVTSITVYCIDDIEVTDKDLIFMNQMPGLTKIDLSKTRVQNNTIPESRFENKILLTEFIMPSTIEVIGPKAFNNTGIKKINVPASIKTWTSTAFWTTPLIFFDGLDPVLPTDNGYFYQNYSRFNFFVDEASITKYQNTFRKDITYNTYLSDRMTKVYPKGELTDDGDHIVRKTSNGYELVFYCGKGDNLQCGFDLTLNGEEVYVTSIGQYCFAQTKHTFDIIFDDSITYISHSAFMKSGVRNVNFNNIRYIEDYAFYDCDKLTNLDLTSVIEIGEYSFSHCDNLFDVNCPELEVAKAYAFHRSINLAQVSFYKLKVLKSNVFYHKTSNDSNVYANIKRINFYNASFDDVEYTTINNSGGNLKVFVYEDSYEQFLATKVSPAQITFPFGEIVGDYKYTRIATIDGLPVECSIDLGEYVITGDASNGKIICCNVPEFIGDYTVPNSFTYYDENLGEEVTKTITSVGPYAFARIKFSDGITFTFGTGIKEVGHHVFYDHVSTSYKEQAAYANKIRVIDFNDVEIIGDSAMSGLLYLVKFNAPNVKKLGDKVFYACTNLFYGEFPNIESVVGTYIFSACTQLVALKFGPNLSEFDAPEMIGGTMPNMRQIIFETSMPINSLYINYNYYAGGSNKNLKIYIQEEVYDASYSGLAGYYKELGEKYGEYYVYNKDKTEKYNIGEYIIKEVTIGDQTGYSICSCNLEGEDIPSNYKVPDSFDSIPVIRIGIRCFTKFDFARIDTANFLNGENFEFPSTLLQIGIRAFAGTVIRVRDFKNIERIDTAAFSTCTNIYLVDASKLEYLGDNVFEKCTNIHCVNAPNLTEVGSLTFSSCTNLTYLFSDIQKAKDNGWMVDLCTFATTEGSTINFAISDHVSSVKLTNSQVAASTTRTFVYSTEEVILTGNFDYEIKDGSGNIIYTFEAYRYVIKNISDEAQIIRCLTTHGTNDEFVIPDLLDGKPVTQLGIYCFRGYSSLSQKTIVFPDSLHTIGTQAFYECQLQKPLDLNNVTSISSQAFKDYKGETITARKVTYIDSQNFMSNPNLTTVYLDSLTQFDKGNTFSGCTNLKTIYGKKLFTFLENPTMPKSGLTFIFSEEIEDASELTLTYWNTFKNVTIFVPYRSLSIYKESFADTSKYVNFTFIPIGEIAIKQNEITELDDIFVLSVIDGKYDYTTQTYEKVFMVSAILTENSDIIIPSEWEHNENGVVTVLPITKIGSEALKNQNTIENITLSENIFSYEEFAFSNCLSLQNIYVSTDNPYFISDNGVLYTKDVNNQFIDLISYPVNHQGTDYTIPNSVKTIKSYAFKDCINIKNVYVGENVTSIGSQVFKGVDLTSIKFGATNPALAVGFEIFDPENIELIVYVPSGSIPFYQQEPAYGYLKLVGYDLE